MPKDFDTWNTSKKQIDEVAQRPVFREGEVWWCHLGLNVGVEMDGKNRAYTRPVVIMRKFNRYSFYGIPLTTKYQENSDFYHVFEFNNQKQAANLSQMRLIDARRLQRRMVDLSDEKFEAIKKALLGLF